MGVVDNKWQNFLHNPALSAKKWADTPSGAVATTPTGGWSIHFWGMSRARLAAADGLILTRIAMLAWLTGVCLHPVYSINLTSCYRWATILSMQQEIETIRQPILQPPLVDESGATVNRDRALLADASIVDQRRYRRILWFFGGVIGHFIVLDLLIGRLLFIGGRVRASRPVRLQQMARRFRALAIDMGGVMIKLGQFLSARVDVLPAEITAELAGLQDEVPPVPFPAIMAALQTELGDVTSRFAEIEERPLAAASLGQAHRATLRGDVQGGAQKVVVKVQRPGIEAVVRTDLAALRVVARWVMRYKPIRRRANVPALMEEFARTLWEELDYRAEAANAERFARIFAGEADVAVPKIYHEHSTGRVLTLENVEGIRINDVAAMPAVGIQPTIVAERLLDVYFKQVFQEGFFHADPHPG